MKITKTKAHEIISKTTYRNHSYFIIHNNKIIFRTSLRNVAIEEMLDIIVSYYEDKKYKPGTFIRSINATLIIEALEQHYILFFSDWCLVYKPRIKHLN